jgi:hypothetical protein
MYFSNNWQIDLSITEDFPAKIAPLNLSKNEIYSFCLQDCQILNIIK